MSKLGITRAEAAERLGRPLDILVHIRRAGLKWTKWTAPPKPATKRKPAAVGPIPRPWTEEADGVPESVWYNAKAPPG